MPGADQADRPHTVLCEISVVFCSALCCGEGKATRAHSIMGACGSKVPGDHEARRKNGPLFADIQVGSPWVNYRASNLDNARGDKPLSSDTIVQVYDIEDKETGDQFTARQIFLSTRKTEGVVNEHVQEVMSLSHPNIARVHSTFLTQCSVHIVMDRVHGGVPLSQYLAAADSLSLGALASMAQQMATIVNYLHESNFVHSFLSPESFMVVPPQKNGTSTPSRAADYEATHPRVVLVDFGLEWKIGRNVGLFVALSHAPYTSPEVATALTTLSLRNSATGEATRAADVFSLGAIFYYLFTGQDLFQGPTTAAILEKVKRDEVGLDHFESGSPGRHVPRAAAALIITMMSKSPVPRIPIRAVVNSEFLREDGSQSNDNLDPELLQQFKTYHTSTVRTTRRNLKGVVNLYGTLSPVVEVVFWLILLSHAIL